MLRCGPAFLLLLAILFILALTGCLGDSSSNPGNGGVTSVTLSPVNNVSMDVGSTQVFSATGKNANGGVVLGVDIRFLVGVPPGASNAPTISMNSNGDACAGTWDASFSICSPGTVGPSVVTAVVNGVSSEPTTVYVHEHIDSIQIQQAQSQPPQFPCFSQGQTWLYKGTAYSNNVDITNSVGPLTWTFSNIDVLTPTNFIPPGQPNVLNQVQTTAKSPGVTQLFASVSGTTSSPYPYTTCLIQSLRLQAAGQGQAGNTVTLNNGSNIAITATAVDTLGFTLASPPLTWSTTNPEVAGFTTTTNTTGTNNATARNNLGGTTVFASCSPPSCNIGVLPGLPVYASDGVLPNGTNGFGTISLDVTAMPSAKPVTYTAWATSTGCQNAPGCLTAMFAVTPGANPVGSIVSNLPWTPNSMMFNHVSTARVYLGSDLGLMWVDVTGANPTVGLVSAASTPCNVSLCGKVLAISNDGKQVVVSDDVSTPRQVYIYNGGGTGVATIDLIIPGETVTAAAFSPDQLKVFLLTNSGNMYVYSTVDALSSVPIATSVTDVEFSSDGSFAYVAGMPSSGVSAFSTCSLPNAASVNIGSVTAATTPMQIFPSPLIPPPVFQGGFFWETQNILALEPATVDVPSTHVEVLASQFRQDPITHNDQFTCNPPVFQQPNNNPNPSYSLGQGSFTPIYAQLVADGTQMVVVGKKIPAVLLLNVSNGSTTSVPLAGGASPLSASGSTDGSTIFVAACDQYDQDGVTCASASIHIVSTVSQGDFQQVPYVNVNNNNDRNMCNNGGNPTPQCLPDLVAIRPQ
jgi:hypothetical protein